MSYTLCPQIKMQFFTNSGSPLSGGRVYTYNSGTTTPKATFTDSTGTSYNTNPIVLDTNGKATIFLDGSYTFEIWSGDKTLPGSILIDTQNDVNGGWASLSDISSVSNHITEITTVSPHVNNIDAISSHTIQIDACGNDLGTATYGTYDLGLITETIDGGGSPFSAIVTTAGSITNVNIVAADKSNVDIVANNIANVDSVANNQSSVNTVSSYIGDVIVNSQNITSIQGAATNATNAQNSATQAAASAASASAIVLGVASNRASVRPSLMLDFAASKTLDPRVTFGRASVGTYYDGKTVAKVEENLLTYSQDFSNAAWTQTSITPTYGQTDPAAGTMAALLVAGGANATLLHSFTAMALPYVFSIYIKSGTVTGNIDITVDGTTWTTQTITGSWTQFNTVLTPAAGAKTCGVRIANSGDSIYVAFAQLEQRSTVTAYTPTTTAPITNYTPQLLTAAAGIPRFDHNPTTGESLGLLIEEQRTNMALYSDQMNNTAFWALTNVTVTPNILIAPDGTLSGDLITVTTSSAGSHRNQINSLIVSSNTTYTFSFYAKLGTCTDPKYSVYDVTNNANIVAPTTYYSSLSALGWTRIIVTFTTPATCTSIYCYTTRNSVSVGTVGIWGAQVEQASFPTSYIPTTSAQVTRSADAASMTGTNFSSWFRADEGTFYCEGAPQNLSGYFVSAGIPGSSTPRISLSLANWSRKFYAYTIADLSGGNLGTATSGVMSKLAGAYKSGDCAAVANGGTAATSTIASNIPVVTQLDIGKLSQGTYILNGTIKRITYWPKRLTNTELQGVTNNA